MITHVRRSIVLAVIMVALVFAYALAGTGLSQALFHRQANGSIGADGSTLIGQNWSSPRWFHGRPDATGPYAPVVCASNAGGCTARPGGDDPLEANGIPGQSGATNLGPRSKVLLADTQQLVAYWRSLGVDPTPDLVTTSGSGYDPDISPADARAQIPMVAGATGVPPASLESLIDRHTHGPEWGFLGSSYIVVLQLNEALAVLETGR